MLELRGVGKFLIEQAKSSSLPDKSVISDICDGSLYSGHFPETLSLTANVDGAPVFKSSSSSMWPVYYVVNNLPLNRRRKQIVLHGLWCGAGKPNMTCFFTTGC